MILRAEASEISGAGRAPLSSAVRLPKRPSSCAPYMAIELCFHNA